MLKTSLQGLTFVCLILFNYKFVNEILSVFFDLAVLGEFNEVPFALICLSKINLGYGLILFVEGFERSGGSIS